MSHGRLTAVVIAVVVAIAAAAVALQSAMAVPGQQAVPGARSGLGVRGRAGRRNAAELAGPRGAASRRAVGGPLLASRGIIVHDPARGGRRLPRVPASAFVVADAATGQVLAAKDPHGYFQPASTLKMLTAITLIPRLRPDARVVASQQAADLRPAERRRPGRGAGAIRSSSLFKALLLISANDAAVSLAQATGSFATGHGHDERRGPAAAGLRRSGKAAERLARRRAGTSRHMTRR